MERIKAETFEQIVAARAVADALLTLQRVYNGDNRPWLADMIEEMHALRFCKNGISPQTGKHLKR